MAKQCFDRLLARAEAERVDGSAELGACEGASPRSVTLAKGNHLKAITACSQGWHAHCWQGSAAHRMVHLLRFVLARRGTAKKTTRAPSGAPAASLELLPDKSANPVQL